MSERMRIEPFTPDLLEAFRPLIDVSSGRPVPLAAERARFDAEAPTHWRVAFDAEGRPLGFVRDAAGIGAEPARGEAHAVYGPDRLRALRALVAEFLAVRTPSPLRFVLTDDDPFGEVLDQLGFTGVRRLAVDLVLGAIPGSVGIRPAEDKDLDAVRRLLGDPVDGTVLVTVGAVRAALRLVPDEEDDRTGVITGFAVDEAARRQGLAQRLLRAACEQASSAGHTRLAAWVPEHNAAARALLDRFGFQRRPVADLRWWERG